MSLANDQLRSRSQHGSVDGLRSRWIDGSMVGAYLPRTITDSVDNKKLFLLCLYYTLYREPEALLSS